MTASTTLAMAMRTGATAQGYTPTLSNMTFSP